MLSNTSGFEKFISSLAIRIALLEITNLPKLNFIAIDEGLGAFDTHNINNVRTIFDFLCSKFDFVLMMTHLDHIKQYVDTQINIKKDANGFSNVRVE
jgi:DNA repair protein SbcC/Rad50